MTVGQRIEEARQAKGLPLVHIARAAGISYESLRNIIRGANSPTLTTLHRVAIALGCRVSDLVEGVEYDGA